MSADDGGFLPLLSRMLEREPERVLATFGEMALTAADLDRRAGRLAHWLLDQGIRPGDHVALMLANSPLALSLMWAIPRAGAVWVPVNTGSRGPALAHILGHSRPRLVIADDAQIDTIAACGAVLAGSAICRAGAAAAAMDSARPTPLPWPAADPDMPYAIMYTSGTTGPAKGVIVSHRMLRYSGEAALLVSGARDGDVLAVWEPLFHIGGAQLIVLPLLRRVRLALLEGFSARRFWSEVKATGASHIHFLGGILQILLKQPEGPLDRAHGARIAWGGGCPREVWRPFEARFGVEIRECYGMTECSSVTTANLEGVLGSVGRALPWLEVEVRRDDGQPVAVGEWGEITVRARAPGAVTRGYLDNPEATAKAFRDGWFLTGDLASLDDAGNLYFHGRRSDSARVRGENVSAHEVESVAEEHPAVEACAMIAVAAEIGEQEIKLLVQRRTGARLEAEELSAWLESRLASYQQPRYIAFVSTFERTPSQRIMKHRLSRQTDDAWDRRAARRST